MWWRRQRDDGALLVPAMVSVYLLAVVFANLIVARYGQAALPWTAFLLVPLDLLTRDVLHHEWANDRLWPKMTALIATGSLLAFALNHDAGRVALASFLAFASAGAVNTWIYHLLKNGSRYQRMVASSCLAAVVDSVVFPFVAFDDPSVWLCVTQATAKATSGAIFSWLFLLRFDREEAR